MSIGVEVGGKVESRSERGDKRLIGSDDRVRRATISRYESGTMVEATDSLAREMQLHCIIDGLGTMNARLSPGSYATFVIGHLCSEGLIDGPDEIEFDAIDRDGERILLRARLLRDRSDADVRAASSSSSDAAAPGARRVGLVLLDAGAATHLATRKNLVRPSRWSNAQWAEFHGGVRASAFCLDPSALLTVCARIEPHTALFSLTGAFHSAFLLDDRLEPRFIAHDIGRHAAVDRVIGMALQKGADLARQVLMTTGRLSRSIVEKCLRARILWLLSRGAPTAAAVGLARAASLGMIGFLREGRFNVYAGASQLTGHGGRMAENGGRRG